MATIKLVGQDDGTPFAYGGKDVVTYQKFTAVATGMMSEFKGRYGNRDSANIKYAIYSDNAGVPYQKLASGVSTVTPGWMTLSIGPVSITNGVAYWLAQIVDDDIAGYVNNTGIRYYAYDTYATFTFPATFNVSGYTNDGYASYVAGWGNIPSGKSFASIF